jgi:EAL domain-containing protein (putative c-di-GMP-specific phosphodiesterase class I)/CheY-like chemotaxis protein
MPPSPTNLGRVLVADDDPIVRALCDRTLRGEGWTVVLATDGDEAVELAARERDALDCIVSDVNMPGAGGFEVLRRMREHDEDVPVLLMTADPSLDGALLAIEGGAVSYLIKPFAPDALCEAVARAARRHGVSRMRRRGFSLIDDSEDRAGLEARFARALEQLWMAFQPIVDVGGRGRFAYEALLRTEEETLRRPDVFLGVAERLGRIQEVGRRVRGAVAARAKDAPADALLFVNVHGLELNDEELYSPTSPLSQQASRVVLEITERVALDGVPDAAARIAMLRRLGFRIAVDDLGAGYAGLASLAALEPEVVKLDMSLVRDIERHPTKRRVVGAMATLTRELGASVVAGGVETEAERAAVRDAGVTLIQGWLIGRPGKDFG